MKKNLGKKKVVINGYQVIPREKKKLTVSKLKKVADKVFSDYIRQRDGYTCFTCGKKGDKTSIQNGHYVSRSFNSLRFDERNTAAQCVGCNIFRRGNMDAYAVALIRKYGSEILETLAAEKKKIKQFTVRELEEIIKKYG